MLDVIVVVFTKVKGKLAGAAALVHALPLLVSKLPDAPGEINPVPPLAAGNMPETSDARLTAPAVMAEVPLPLTTPVNVAAPVPPLLTGNVPEAVETLTGGIILERVAMLSSG